MADNPRPRKPESSRDRLLAYQQYEPVIHEQVQRLINTDGLGLRNPSKVASVTQNLAVSIAATYGKQPSDEQILAMFRKFSQSLNWMLFFQFSVGCWAGAQAFKGRKTFRFPFWTPKPENWRPALNPHKCGQGGRFIWHGLRWTSYYALYSAFLAPISSLFLTTALTIEFRNDPRFRGLMRAERQQNHAQPSDDQTGWGSSSQSERITDQASFNAESSISAQARTGWDAPRRQQKIPSSQQDSWDSIPDDASPTTSQDEGRDTNSSGSAWDRVRQQSRGQQGSDAGNATFETAYGHDRNAAGTQDRGGGESYSFSSSDEERAAAKTVSQKEFDDLLERERRGVDQQSTSGRRT
ncbi:hypothetical protein CDD80_1739 [Ophiocordyceps camponoti-rufipedis]|uniref:Uncharacterized protein n=1 Tax=Ophiocordyceps camponoti-rufipedis TaxID=2004952 RepID=A0A2C5Z9U6_9HYPO|nr:hypothetical protein CDD80_1739 [Ophiocordyceps camponoti-rufipedis]